MYQLANLTMVTDEGGGGQTPPESVGKPSPRRGLLVRCNDVSN